MEATITTDGKRILARIPYANGAGPKWAKLVPGARWCPQDKTWRYPLSMETCRKFRNVFGENLMVMPTLSIWARQEVARERQLELWREGNADGSNAAAAKLLSVAEKTPNLFKAINERNYQLLGSAFLAESRTALLGDQPGLGKTLQALAAVIQNGAKEILVSCPRTATRTVWMTETNQWASHIMPFVCQGTRAEREQVFQAFRDTPYPGPKMLIINTEMIRMTPEICPYGPLKKCPSKGETREHKHKHDVAEWPFLFVVKWDAIIIDEAHNLLASTANIQSKRITQGRYGAMKLRRRVRPGGIVMALSGTPARSKLDKFWGTLNWLAPKQFGSFWRFAETHFGVTDNGWGKVVGHIDEKGKHVVEPLDREMWESALRPYYLARTKQAAAPDLPPIAYAGSPPAGSPDGLNGIWVDMTPGQVRSYRSMKDVASASIAGGRVTATGVLAEISRLRQLASSECRAGEDRELIPAMPSPKIDWILEFLRERQGHIGKVVIASSFTKMVNLVAGEIRKEFGQDYVTTLTGETSDGGRLALVRQFQDSDSQLRVVVLNSKAGGEAITLDQADDMIFIDLPWTEAEATQVESRIHRVSRIHNVTVYRLLSRGTVDEWIASLNDEQRRILQSANVRKLSELAMEALK